MPTIKHLILYFKQYGSKHRALYLMSFLILFWALFDGILSYIAPIVITNNGISTALMGIIIGSSSIAGALFDFLLCKIFKSAFFRRVFIAMFAFCFIFPLVLWKAQSFIVYIIAMAIWGIYYDLKNFGIFDFVSRHNGDGNHAGGFGVVQVFQAIGYLMAPIIVGLLIANAVDWKPFALAWVFLSISFIFFIILICVTRHEKHMIDASKNADGMKRNFFLEARLWAKIGRIIFPVLILTLVLNIIDAFFWTIGPIFAESFTKGRELSGLFLSAYELPSLAVGWFIGSITLRIGKKRTAYFSLFFGALLFSAIYFIGSPWLIVADVFVASCFISASWPAINGAYSDYISEKVKYEKEIAGLQDFFTNAGYVVGPMLAGVVASLIGNAKSFAVLGFFGVLASLLLIVHTPKEIRIDVK